MWRSKKSDEALENMAAAVENMAEAVSELADDNKED